MDEALAVVRWATVLPVAYLAGLLAFLVVGLLSKFLHGGVAPPSFRPWAEFVDGAIAAQTAFFWAPAHQFLAAAMASATLGLYCTVRGLRASPPGIALIYWIGLATGLIIQRIH